MAGLTADLKGTPRHQTEDRKECAEQAEKDCRPRGPITRNCRRVQSACVQAAALFGAELWWKGDGIHGTQTHQEDLQKLVNQKARYTTGAFRTTNQGALSMEPGLRPTATQLGNCQRRLDLRLASLPKENQARELSGAVSTLGNRLQYSLGCWDRKEETVPLEVASPRHDREGAHRQTGSLTHGPARADHVHRRLSLGTQCHWLHRHLEEGHHLEGHKIHMGWGQEAYDTECAAIARAL